MVTWVITCVCVVVVVVDTATEREIQEIFSDVTATVPAEKGVE